MHIYGSNQKKKKRVIETAQNREARCSILFFSFFLCTYGNNGLGRVVRCGVVTRDDDGATVGGLASVAVLLLLAAADAVGVGVRLDQVDIVVVVGTRGAFVRRGRKHK